MSDLLRITQKERALIKGALRRIFSRSELRRSILDRAAIEGYLDVLRPRVTRWCRCESCNSPTPRYLMEVDHISPVQPPGVKLEDLSIDELVNRIWCEVVNLQAICPPCHKRKTSLELKERIRKRKEGKKIP